MLAQSIAGSGRPIRPKLPSDRRKVRYIHTGTGREGGKRENEGASS